MYRFNSYDHAGIPDTGSDDSSDNDTGDIHDWWLHSTDNRMLYECLQ